MQKQQKKAHKDRKQQAQAGGTPAEEAKSVPWNGAHPWQPFDREKLNAGRQAVTGSDMMRKTGALSDRFAR